MPIESLAEISVENFTAFVGEDFEVAIDESEGPVQELTLVSAAEVGAEAQREGRVPFSLTFDGPAETPLEQGTYWFTRSDFGTHGIFIVPIGQKGKTRTYEAIFS